MLSATYLDAIKLMLLYKFYLFIRNYTSTYQTSIAVNTVDFYLKSIYIIALMRLALRNGSASASEQNAACLQNRKRQDRLQCAGTACFNLDCVFRRMDLTGINLLLKRTKINERVLVAFLLANGIS